MTHNPPVDVQQFGQSIWLDNISRKLLDGGELERLLREDGVLGVTSNPTIFQKAISDSNDYDESLMTMLDLNAQDIFERLAIEDIQRALDLLRPIYDRTGGRDGFVSFEVSPLLANDTASTIAEAQRLAAAVDRPNLMIKIPATQAGIPAIEESIAAGININVTLIFSVRNYDAVAEAYIRGLERRKAAGESVAGLQSVASFFLSRIDTAVDRMLDNNIRAAQGRDLGRVALNNRLKGKTAINNAKVAYKHFLNVFYGDRFADLRAAGAAPQRVLWASTGTKNPAYPDTLYLDALIGRETVNTVPPDTLRAFKDHGTVGETLIDGMDEAQEMLDMLAEVGVDLEHITRQLQTDAVEMFIESYESLLEHVDAKRNVLATGVIRQQETALGIYVETVRRALADLDARQANARLWRKDGRLWKDNDFVARKIEERLGWLDVAQSIDRARLKTLQAEAKAFSAVVLLGMGGSSLAPDVLAQTFGTQDGYPCFYVIDSTDPVYIASIEAKLDLARTLFIVSSKSGGTLETTSLFHYFYQKTGERGEQFIAITDAGSSLEALARERSFRDVFLNPADIGGRYSALSYFGLVPAALMGIDLDALWASAERMMKACGAKIRSVEHPGMLLGAILGAIGGEGRDKISVLCSPSIATFGNWVEQLIAESTGKDGRGLLPVVGATVGKPHDYASDRLFIFLREGEDDNSETDDRVRMLREAGHPLVTLHLDDRYALGGEFFRWAYATAIAGRVLDINPFDEPNVTESKENTARLLAHEPLPTAEPLLVDEHILVYADERMKKVMYDLCYQHNYTPNTLSGLLGSSINATEAGNYFAILAYLPPLHDLDMMLRLIQRRLRHGTRRAVTVGYGPRYLHSTGQLHKGGKPSGVFVQLTCDDPTDLDIPGAGYTFGRLKAAQAAGDLEALQKRNRPAIRLHLRGDLLSGLQKLLDVVEEAGERRQG
jgi:transaldolase/glucose-6-phosphate isomerase